MSGHKQLEFLSKLSKCGSYCGRCCCVSPTGRSPCAIAAWHWVYALLPMKMEQKNSIMYKFNAALCGATEGNRLWHMAKYSFIIQPSRGVDRCDMLSESNYEWNVILLYKQNRACHVCQQPRKAVELRFINIYTCSRYLYGPRVLITATRASRTNADDVDIVKATAGIGNQNDCGGVRLFTIRALTSQTHDERQF